MDLYIGGRAVAGRGELLVRDKTSGEIAYRAPLADAAMMEQAIAEAFAARRAMQALPSHERRRVLDHCARALEARAEELAQLLVVEVAKPIRDARGEVQRLLETFRIAAEECTRIYGEVLPMDITPRASGVTGMWRRAPIGVCAFITPFNFPLNLAAHKIAPAIAAGCPFVLKPAPATPISALVIGEVLASAGLPPGAFSILPCELDVASQLVTDERIAMLSFTGSAKVGWALRAQAGRKRVTLELGGNAAVIVDEGADLDACVARLVMGAFYQSGQSCISVQRVFVHESIYWELRDKLMRATKAVVMGDPKEESTVVAPLIDEKAATRIEEWLRSANSRGATVLVGGGRKGALFEPTLVEHVPKDEPLWCEEVFGPVACLERFADFDEALDAVNDSPYGLQAGVFTKDIDKAHRAWDRLEVGAVVINDVPSFRVDHMPYGGVKASGLGREGVRFAIEEMSEVRMMIIKGG